MMLNDRQIDALCGCTSGSMISPYSDQQHTDGYAGRCISWGLSSFGYDIRAGLDFRIFKAKGSETLDPKTNAGEFFRAPVANYEDRLDPVTIPAHGFALCNSVEYFRMPLDVLGVCIGKSTYARCGIIVNITPLEPGWVGTLTIEVSNTTDSPCLVYPGEGIAQVLFFKGREAPAVTYASRKGKYMRQTGVTLPRL